MDNYSYSVVLVELDAGEDEVSRFTNSQIEVTHETNSYTPSPAMKINPQALTGDFSGGEYKIENIDLTLPILLYLKDNVPYSKIASTIKEVFYDDDGEEVGTEYLHKGFVYQCDVRRSRGYADLVFKDHKYYTDTTAGIPCTELCAVAYFGDTICQKTVYSETHTIDSISGYQITLVGPLIDTTSFLFNHGTIQNGAQRLKIKYHESGLVFQMAKPIPTSWEGAIVEVFAGCDKQLATCQDIHDNEENFLGLGIAMVDYNPLYETS
jgi:hypothetical protein